MAHRFLNHIQVRAPLGVLGTEDMAQGVDGARMFAVDAWRQRHVGHTQSGELGEAHAGLEEELDGRGVAGDISTGEL